MPKKYDGITWNNLQLTQTAAANIIRSVSASSQLTLFSLADVQHKIKLVSSLLELTDLAESNNIIYLTASNELKLTHGTSKSGTTNIETENTLDFTHKARITLHVERIEHQLELTHEVILAGLPLNLAASSELNTTQSVVLRKSKYHITATNYLSLSQQAAPIKVGEASNHLHLSHTCRPVLYETPISYLHLVQEATCHNVQGVENVLDLTHSVLVTGVLLGATFNQLNLRSVCSYFIVNFCDYTPGIGAGSFDYTPPSPIVPTLVRRSTTILTWPYSIPTLTVELRNPNFDNVEQYSFQRINRRTLGGKLDLFRDEDWPKIQKLILNFSTLSEIQTEELFTFLEKSIGQEIGLLDFESRQWRGLIITPNSAISQPRSFNTSLEFEGALV